MQDADAASNDGQRPKSETPAPSPGIGSHAVRWQIQPYYHIRSLPQKHLKPLPSEILWNKNAGKAAELHAVDLMQHQLLPARATPHPTDGAQRRWPENSCCTGGGLVDAGDDRRHAHWFGYREARWKRHWALQRTEESEDMVYPSLTMEIIHQFLVEQFGSLQTGFNALDFFQDCHLSFLELREGLLGLMRNAPASKFRSLAELPSHIFTSRVRTIFKGLDADGDGLINFEEFSAQSVPPSEPSKALTSRRLYEMQAAFTELGSRRNSILDPHSADGAWGSRAEHNADVGTSPFRVSLSMSVDMASAASEKESSESYKEVLPDVHQFAIVLLSKFRNIEEAFKAIDLDGQGRITMSEFSLGAKMLRFKGDPSVVFKALDSDHRGLMSIKDLKKLQKVYDLEESPETQFMSVTKSRREVVAARRQRSPILQTQQHARGRCISDGDVRPLGERVSSSAGFFSFARNPTGRLDLNVHPDELPATDSAGFSENRGPGYLAKGPEHFGISHTGDPVRGSKFKAGSTVPRTRKMGPVVPSHAKRLDVERGLWANYEGDRPKDGWHVCSSGAISMRASDSRSSPTYMTAGATARAGTKPIGPWRQSRVGNTLRSTSAPSLLHLACC